MEDEGAAGNLSAETDSTAIPSLRLSVATPVPVTTTSVNCLTSMDIRTSITDLAPTPTSAVASPMNENTSVPSVGTPDRVYFPSESVTPPLVVPLTITFTPGRAEPSSSDVTVPDTV